MRACCCSVQAWAGAVFRAFAMSRHGIAIGHHVCAQPLQMVMCAVSDEAQRAKESAIGIHRIQHMLEAQSSNRKSTHKQKIVVGK
jgi:hypothetical protein